MTILYNANLSTCCIKIFLSGASTTGGLWWLENPSFCECFCHFTSSLHTLLGWIVWSCTRVMTPNRLSPGVHVHLVSHLQGICSLATAITPLILHCAPYLATNLSLGRKTCIWWFDSVSEYLLIWLRKISFSLKAVWPITPPPSQTLSAVNIYHNKNK